MSRRSCTKVCYTLVMFCKPWSHFINSWSCQGVRCYWGSFRKPKVEWPPTSPWPHRPHPSCMHCHQHMHTLQCSHMCAKLARLVCNLKFHLFGWSEFACISDLLDIYFNAGFWFVWLFLQTDVRSISVSHWGSELGLQVLRGLSRLYISLVWEKYCPSGFLQWGCPPPRMWVWQMWPGTPDPQGSKTKIRHSRRDTNTQHWWNGQQWCQCRNGIINNFRKHQLPNGSRRCNWTGRWYRRQEKQTLSSIASTDQTNQAAFVGFIKTGPCFGWAVRAVGEIIRGLPSQAKENATGIAGTSNTIASSQTGGGGIDRIACHGFELVPTSLFPSAKTQVSQLSIAQSWAVSLCRVAILWNCTMKP